MGKSMFKFGKNTKEKARQLKQTEKTAKRLLARKRKADMAKIPDKKTETAEPELEVTNCNGIKASET